ncbi:MAG: hypothetical protein P1U87_13360 [Verrucomicrobiales bacterium]|nr:hypothetical protein [Verrucomicrobiales bacterium]
MKRIFFLACFSLLPAHGEEIEFTFHVYQMEPAIGAALEDRLIAGGAAAAEAMDKLPDFVRQGRVTELDSLAFTAPPDERTVKKSKDSTITLPTREAADGLEVEVDPFLQGSIINLNFYASFTTQKKEDIRERGVTSQTQCQSGIPMLLCRWQMKDEWLLLTGTATAPGGGKPEPSAGDVLYLESAYYQSGASAKSGRDKLASTRTACRSGQRCRSEIIGWLDDENILEDDQPGFRSLLDPVLKEDGILEVRVDCGLVVEAGGRTRLESGERVRRLEMRDVSGLLVMKEGEPAGRKAELSRLNDNKTVEDNYVAAFRFLRGPSE